MFARATFLPTLLYNLFRNRWTSWNWYDRIDDTVVLGALPFHGPVTQTLLSEENIRGVISMNEDFELRLVVSNRDYWHRIGIPFLQLNTPDILHSPAQDKLEQGVNFILSHQHRLKVNEFESDYDRMRAIMPSTQPRLELPWSIKNNGNFLDQDLSEEGGSNNNNNEDGNDNRFNHQPSVYVHCKAGRTRSATLVACYLIKRYGLTPEESVRFMTKRRSQVFLHTKQWQAINEYYKRHGTLHRTASQELRIKEANFDMK